MNKTSSKHFYDKLNLAEFEILAKRWATEFPVIKRISLFCGINNRYSLSVGLKEGEGTDEYRAWFQAEYRRFEREWIDGDYPLGEIHSIYKSSISDWHGDWEILLPWKSEPDDKPSSDIYADRYVIESSRYVLYGKEIKATERGPDDFSPEIIDLINKARQEIELIYKEVKEGEGFNNVGGKHANARMKDALNYFEEYKDKFNIIAKEVLENEEIFETSTAQCARKVKGMLLQRIVIRYGLGRHPYYKLFKEHQKQKNYSNS